MKKTTLLWVNFSSGITCTAARSQGISFFVDNSLLVIPIHLLITPFFFFFSLKDSTLYQSRASLVKPRVKDACICEIC